MTSIEIVVVSVLVPLAFAFILRLDSNDWRIRTPRPNVNQELETHLAVFTDFSDAKLRRGLMLTWSEAKALYKIVKYHNSNSLFEVPDLPATKSLDKGDSKTQWKVVERGRLPPPVSTPSGGTRVRC